MRIAFISTLLSLIFLSSHAADWQGSVKNLQVDENNSILYLQYTGAVDQNNKHFIIQVKFMQKGRLPSVLQKEQLLEVSESNRSFKMGFWLDPGHYEVSINISNRELSTFLQLPIINFQSTIHPNSISVSDLFLTYAPISNPNNANPILDAYILPDKAKLYLMVELYAPEPAEYTIRSVLDKFWEDKSTEKIDLWQNKQNTNRILKVSGPKVTIREQLDISQLTEGDYHIQVIIYQNGEDRFYPTLAFTIEGETRQRIFTDLEKSIQQMRYILPAFQVDSLLNIENAQLRERLFRQAWSRLYSDEADNEMLSYYKKIYKAESFVSSEGGGWASDRGRIFVQFGEPERSTFTLKGKDYERWTYQKYDISFLFEKRNQDYVLVE